MGQYNSNNTWTYNCTKEDLDYRAQWGNDGVLTVHVNNLKTIRYTLWRWNSRDGWIQSGPHEQSLDQPTSQPHVFYNVAISQGIGGANNANLYWGRRYRIETLLEIISFDGQIYIIQDHDTSVTGCFINGDSNYHDVYGCTPGGTQCEPL